MHAHERERDSSDSEPTNAPHPRPDVSVSQLQRTVGNAVTARLLSGRPAYNSAGRQVQRNETTEAAEAAPALKRIREINLQGGVGPVDELELQLLWGTFPDLETDLFEADRWADFSKSVRAGMDLDKVDGCTSLVKIWVIHDKGWRMTPEDAEELAILWGSYGSTMVAKAQEYLPTWQKSIARGMDPDDIPVIEELKRTLEDDVRAVASRYLDQNLAAVEEERERLGVGARPAAHDPAAARDELVRNAGVLRELVAVRDTLRGIAVGRQYEDVASDEGAPDDEFAEVPDPLVTLFDPEREPDVAPEQDDAMLPWEVVKSLHDLATVGLMAVAGTSPVLYGALESDRVDELDPSAAAEDVAATAHVVLLELQLNILDTRENLEGDLDWHELSPIISELARGQVAEDGSGIDWSEPFHASLLRDEAGDYAIVRALEEMAWLIPAVALMFTPLGWPALVAGGLLAAGEAAQKYERWDELRAAAGAGATPETELVASTQVRGAEAELILATVFAFLSVADDIGALAQRGARAARAGSAVAKLDVPAPGRAGGATPPSSRPKGKEVLNEPKPSGPQPPKDPKGPDPGAGYKPLTKQEFDKLSDAQRHEHLTQWMKAHGVERIVRSAKHHAWPEYLGGPANQPLLSLDEFKHNKFHTLLDTVLPRNSGSAFYAAKTPVQKAEDIATLKRIARDFDIEEGTKISEQLRKVLEGTPYEVIE